MPSPTAGGVATIGRIVHYRLHERDIKWFADERKLSWHWDNDIVFVQLPERHFGSAVREGATVPLLLTGVPEGHPGWVSGYIFMEGAFRWLHEAQEGTEPGQWSWPPRV